MEKEEKVVKEEKLPNYENTMDIPMKGKTLKEHLSNESACCCDTILVCSIHNESIKLSS